MPITAAQVQIAQTAQHEAGRDVAAQVRLVAGPGTGKSSTIEERVRWLMAAGADPESVAAVSFTRASAFDLRGRIHGYCLVNGQPNGADVAVTTLHSLAMRTLRRANALGGYPADPLVLDDWELRNIFEAEFGREAGVGSIPRREAIRRDHEAFWSTGSHEPPTLIPPDPPITQNERASFAGFHARRTQTYSCVLPGEIVRKCVEQMEAGILDPAELLGLEHIIVDEFQDLNPMDLDYVNGLTAAGVTLFVAGDDDQSLYSFRFASPAGIQNFLDQYPVAGDHELDACFRCTPAVVTAGRGIIEAHHMENRIPKDLASLYADADPPLEGSVACWRFATGRKEAEGIAASCAQLLDCGLSPRNILILLSNQRAQGPDLFRALEQAGVAFEKPRPEPFRDTDPGRLVFAFARIVTNPFDYVAHRTVLGQQRGVGVASCSQIARKVVEHNLNYRELFHAERPDGVFTGREQQALRGAESLIAELESWAETDELGARVADMGRLLENARDEDAAQEWFDYATTLPPRMTLSELSTFLVLDKDEQQEQLLIDVYRRLQEEAPIDLMPPRIRIMSMHGAKGLSASVVIVPGLEEEVLPGPRRRPYPGLVLEAARMLYVSITRARHTCILSYSSRRFMNGVMRSHAPSRFTTAVGTPFSYRDGGLTQDEANAIVTEVALL